MHATRIALAAAAAAALAASPALASPGKEDPRPKPRAKDPVTHVEVGSNFVHVLGDNGANTIKLDETRTTVTVTGTKYSFVRAHDGCTQRYAEVERWEYDRQGRAQQVTRRVPIAAVCQTERKWYAEMQGGDDQVTWASSIGGIGRFFLGDGNDRFRNLANGGVSDGMSAAHSLGVVTGDQGNDVLEGSASAETLAGGAGNDRITGGGGADTIRGDAGDDTLRAKDATADKVACGDGLDSVEADQGLDEVDLDCDNVS